MTARQHILPSGLKVVCDPVPGLRSLAVAVTAEGGARHEDEARSGWSHLLEHMVFKGAAGRDAKALIERIEAVGGTLNAGTGQERTTFSARVLAPDLGIALETVSDLMVRPTLDPVELEREKDVIAQEIAEAFDAADDQVFELAQGQAFAGQPLGRPILGTVESLARADAGALADWRRRLYAPERMVVSVSGAVDETELLALVERWFDPDPSGLDAAVEPGRFVGGVATDVRRIEQANLVLSLPGIPTRDPDVPALALLMEIFGGGMASRLFQEARELRGLAYSVDAGFDTYADAGFVTIFAGTAADKAGAFAELAATEALKLADGVTDAELDRARAQAMAGLYMSEESLTARAERHAFQALVWGEPTSVEARAKRIADVTHADLRRVAERLLAPGRAAASMVGPKAAAPAPEVFIRTLFGPDAA